MPDTTSSACSAGSVCAAPLWRTARANSPFAAGIASKAAMLIAPADSPNTVIASGSPPKAAISDLIQDSAAT